MAPNGPEGWEPDARKMGNWRSLFEEPQTNGQAAGQQAPSIVAEPEIDDGLVLDMAEYRPWVMQRVRSRIPAMLHLRRYESKSDRWMGWLMPYPGLCAVEYLGEGMLTFDFFGTRQFIVEGRGLDELARRIQEGTVLAVQEYSSVFWPTRPPGVIVSSIRKLGAPAGATA